MKRFDENELIELKDFRERVIYLFQKTHCGSRRKFCQTHNLAKTVFYEIWNGVRTGYTDYIIEKYAKAFNVSFEFMKYGGSDAGYYYGSFEDTDRRDVSRVSEEGAYYPETRKRQRRKMPVAIGKGNIIISANDPEEILEVLMKIRYQDIDF